MRNRNIRNAPLAAALGLAVAMAAAPGMVSAQEGYDQAPPPVELTETKINQFVDALQEISDIRHEVSAQMEAAGDMEEAQRLQQDAQAQMIEAVENAGLTVEEYNQIASTMGSDPEMQEEIRSRLEERS